jgi:hypothetical protein
MLTIRAHMYAQWRQVGSSKHQIAFTELKGARAFDISWDRKYLVGAGAGQAQVWDAETGKLVRSFPMPK